MKRALILLSLSFVCLAALAATLAPISPVEALAALSSTSIKEGKNTAAPRTLAAAKKHLNADVAKLASDYRHGRYKAVCADLTAKQREQLGGTKGCMLKMMFINTFAPIKKFTIVKAILNKRHTSANVFAYINGNKKRRLGAAFKWEGGSYRFAYHLGKLPKF